jgi:hypothetical protein
MPSIDQFFFDIDFGYLKFAGYDKGYFLFTTFEKMSGKWVRGAEMTMHPAKFEAKLNQKELKPSFPPQ